MKNLHSITCFYQLISALGGLLIVGPFFGLFFVVALFSKEFDNRFAGGPSAALIGTVVGVVVAFLGILGYILRTVPRRVTLSDEGVQIKFLLGSDTRPYTEIVEATVQFHNLMFGGPTAIPKVTDPTEFTLVFKDKRKFNLRVVPQRRREFFNFLASKLAELNEPPVQANNPFAVKLT